LSEPGEYLSLRAEERMSFVLRLRARGIAEVSVLRALETVPRHLFVPHHFADLAWRDIALPIACGQTMSQPYALARVMEALRVERDHRVLEIGAGSGYGTAILGKLGAEIISFERYRTLAVEAAERLSTLGFVTARIIHGDGLAPPATLGIFDRILIDGVVDDIPADVMALLARDGVIVFAREDAQGRCQMWRRTDENVGGLRDELLFSCRADTLARGFSTTF
jgi:protein-L-isoaspartate(D-aspartate) O-methyltransferase